MPPGIVGGIGEFLIGLFGATVLATSTAAIVVGSVVVTTVSSIVIGQINRLFQKKPAATTTSALGAQSGTAISTRATAAPRAVVYGTVVIPGIYTYLEVTGTNNEYLHAVYALSGCEIEVSD